MAKGKKQHQPLDEKWTRKPYTRRSIRLRGLEGTVGGLDIKKAESYYSCPFLVIINGDSQVFAIFT